MDGKNIQSKMKAATANFANRASLWVVIVCVVCSAFLVGNYLLVNQRIAALEGKLESLQRSEKRNPNVSFNDQTGAKEESHAREKRSVNQSTRDRSIADIEKRVQDLEKRYLVIFAFQNVLDGCKTHPTILPSRKLITSLLVSKK